MFYKTRFSTSKFFLLNYNSLIPNKINTNRDTFGVYTNSDNLLIHSTYTFKSTSTYCNRKFLISKFLTLFFKSQSYIPRHVSKRYFCRLRQLLLTQFGAITARINKPSSSRRRTKVYIRFSYKKDITYFGFYLPCTHDLSSGPCNLPVSHCMSRVPQRCPLHYSDTNRTHIPITTPSRKSNDIPPFTHLGHEPKRVFIPRLNISFTKRFISDDLFYDHLDTQYIPLPSNKPHKHYFGIARTDLQINSQSPAQRKRWARSCYKTSQWIAELKTKRKSAGKKAKNTIDPPWVGCRFPLTQIHLLI